jgi:hypothetical protein
MYNFASKNQLWMRLETYEEVELLREMIKELEFGGEIISAEEVDDPKLGKRILVVVSKPPECKKDGCKHINWYGKNYHKWETIKSRIYMTRRIRKIKES